MFAVIMAGGAGTRFWPVSRRRRPKQFLSITGKNPMVVETSDRLLPLIPEEQMVVVLGREHWEEARELFEKRRVEILAEPRGRNTAPCIGLGALYARHRGWTAPLAFLPADHFIGDPSAFLEGLRRAGRIAGAGGIVTLGIVPNRPETGYGYIRKGAACSPADGGTVFEAAAFVEKPDLDKARQYLARGDYLWNAGIFVATAETILEEIKEYLPGLHGGLRRLEGLFGSEGFEEELERVYDELEAVSFDYGVMERTGNPVYVLPCDCGWSDVGSWASLYELRKEERDGKGNLTQGDSLLVDCENSYVANQGSRLLACIGLRNCLVVDTGDALLVADLDKSQEVREIIKRLREKGRDELL
ncbi:MAG: mannose-1-phosphate guanylyltransferase [Deltaproteobacteria bacterium]|nr:mannose-1-phosphate guanylyltransferase [Deltaproteobacteria bacterium]